MKTNKKLLSLVLAVVLTLSLSVTAFASWNQFQSNSSNNGLITSSSVPTTSAAQASTVSLATAPIWTADSGLPGVDNTPVVVGNTAYVLYNADGGTYSNGGVRVSAISLGNSPGELWSTKVSGNLSTDGVSQLGTPYYDESTNLLYAPVTYSQNILAGKTPTVSGGATLSSDNILSLPGNNTTCTLTYTDVVIEGRSKMTYIPTGITAASGVTISGEVAFTSTSGNSCSYGTSFNYTGYEFCLYNQTGDTIQPGTYTVTITIRSSSYCRGSDPVRAVTPYWRLYKMNASSTTAPTASPVALSGSTYVEGAGQFNGPITATTYNGHKYLYFGIYDGDRAYYQYDATANDLKSFYYFRNADGFYWAGAAVVGDSVYFGGEGGYVFKRPIGSTFASASNVSTYLSGNAIRSSICYDGSNLYLTTKDATLWKLSTDLQDKDSVSLKDGTNDQYVQNASSTPVVSPSGRIYVGGYNITWNNDGTSAYKGALKAVDWSDDEAVVDTIWSSDSNGAIQSSPVVYNSGSTDYIYFTTNGANGKAVCVSYDTDLGDSATKWSVNSGTYTLQGFAVSDSGYLVFGNDNNKVLVIK